MRRATPGYGEPWFPQLDRSSGLVQPPAATPRKCLLSSRPQVRVLLGAQVRLIFRWCVQDLEANRGANHLDAPRCEQRGDLIYAREPGIGAKTSVAAGTSSHAPTACTVRGPLRLAGYP